MEIGFRMKCEICGKTVYKKIKIKKYDNRMGFLSGFVEIIPVCKKHYNKYKVK